MDKSSSSSESGVSNQEAIYGKPVRAAARKASKAMRTLTFKEKGKGSSSGDGDASKSSSKSWGSTKSGRRQLERESEPEDDCVIGPRPISRSPKKSCTAQGDKSGYPRLGSLQSPCKRPSKTQAPSGLFKKRKAGRPKGSKNKNPGGSKSDPGSRASMGGK